VLAEDLYRLIGRSRRCLWLTAARNLEARGESVFAWQIVSYVARNGPTTQRELAYAVAQHPAGISRQVDAIERLGLVQRKPVSDHRRLLIEVTAKGRKWYETVSPAVMVEVSDLLGELSEPLRRQLAALLEMLLASVETRVNDAEGALDHARGVAARGRHQAPPVTSPRRRRARPR
jgi:DNA-binding MarR family transcriptional regulator